MTFNESTWLANIEADGRTTYENSFRGLNDLLSSDDHYWVSLLERLYRYLEKGILPFQRKWWIEDLERLRGEYKIQGKKCLEERSGDLWKIYMRNFYGMIGRLNREGGEYSSCLLFSVTGMEFLGNWGRWNEC
jgi:hypothetical protein